MPRYKKIRLGFSTCPNDTFIFDGIVNGKVDLEGVSFDFLMDDVETLNQIAFRGEADMIKVSFYAYLAIRKDYVMLHSGCALGYGNGPLLIARENIPLSEIRKKVVAIPGIHTTAHLLFKIAFPDAHLKRFMIFSAIEDTILSRDVDCGVIIHENRFTYEQKGLIKVLDLGAYWEQLTGFPVPLGGIAVKRSLGSNMIHKLKRIMRRSVEHAMDHPEEAMDFVREHAQAMEDEVMKKHIELYVNDYTLDPGPKGREAIRKLEECHHSLPESNPS